jgi:hypothetical protein|tara:strand:+ start:274 stop:459 length:186 start_codon:yes stop_codon:yes gene_type:complete
MRFRTITKANNKKRIMIYYGLAVIFVSIGLFLNDFRWDVIGAVFLGLALIRKYWLMKRLKD